ncbi:MAG TPA: ribonuclease H-like domain-containing protein [Anaerolineales bacterium]|nr:ribonuclease H-like domain-containing protein [Anaerolineales bacterium]
MASPRKSTITDRLNHFKKASELPRPKRKAGYEIDSVVDGLYLSTRLGDVFVAEKCFTTDYLHGSSSILCSSSFSLVSQWAHDPRIADLPLSALAYLDTETSGLTGGTGTYAFLVGAARFIDGKFVLKQFFMRDPGEEEALLEGLADFLAPARALVTFNGKAFDAPILVTRYLMNRMPVPFTGYSHIDLLPLARRLWRDRLESRALKYLEEHVLGMRRTSEEVPGYEIPWLYMDYLRTRDARPLAGVFYHNAMDVVAMAALLAHMNEIITNPYEGRVAHGLDFIALGKLFEDLGLVEEAARLFERGLQHEITEPDFKAALMRLSILQKRRGDFEEALRLWKQAAEAGHIYAHIEIAKYYEHKRRDVKSALAWTRTALEHLQQASRMASHERKHWLEEISHRLARLERKDGI